MFSTNSWECLIVASNQQSSQRVTIENIFMKNMVTRVARSKMQQFFTGSWNFAWLLDIYLLVTRWLSFVLCYVDQ